MRKKERKKDKRFQVERYIKHRKKERKNDWLSAKERKIEELTVIGKNEGKKKEGKNGNQ